MIDDPVDHPHYYNKGSIEVIDFIIDQDMPYLTATAMKYLCRYRWKGEPIQDLNKAVWYLQRQIDELEKEAQKTQS